MISNPCNYYVDGMDKEKFTYEGGRVLYHFSPKDSGLSEGREMNVIFFADDKEHAKRVLSRMLRHKLFCHEKYNKANKHNASLRNMDKVRHLLANHNQWKITLAPLNQFYKVGWANNDEV